jgi:hypothetical protein
MKRQLFWFFLLFCLFDGRHGWKNHSQLKRTALKYKKKKHMHTGKELEVHWVEKGRLSCDSDAPQVGSVRSDWTRVVKVNRRKSNRRKTRPYCIFHARGSIQQARRLFLSATEISPIPRSNMACFQIFQTPSGDRMLWISQAKKVSIQNDVTSGISVTGVYCALWYTNINTGVGR